jgi:hypothetical protein
MERMILVRRGLFPKAEVAWRASDPLKEARDNSEQGLFHEQTIWSRLSPAAAGYAFTSIYEGSAQKDKSCCGRFGKCTFVLRSFMLK